MNSTSEHDALTAAVKDYFAAMRECNKCPAMLLSCGTDPRPAVLMQEMYEAQSKMLKLVGINYHGGKLDDESPLDEENENDELYIRSLFNNTFTEDYIKFMQDDFPSTDNDIVDVLWMAFWHGYRYKGYKKCAKK